MIDVWWVPLLVLGFASPDEEVTGRAIADEVTAVLGRKGGTYPYFAEYDLALPAQPRPSGGTESRRYFVEAADRLYLEETRETFTSKILLDPKTLLYDYTDSNGHALCTGPADLAGTTPERWLLRHGFPLVTLDQLDRELIDNLRGLLAGCTTLRKEEGAGLRTFHLASRIGPLTVVLGPARVEVARPAMANEPPKVLFRYAHGTDKPPWVGAVAEMSARFKDPKAEIQRLAGDFTWIESLEAAIPELDGRVVLLDGTALAKLVRRHGYLLPGPAAAKVVEAKTMNGQLHLKLESGGSAYNISQYPRSSRFADDEGLVPFTRSRRKLGDYAVLDIVDPGTGINRLYYIKPDTAMIVLDPGYRKLDFKDRTLDRLIQSFAAPKP